MLLNCLSVYIIMKYFISHPQIHLISCIQKCSQAPLKKKTTTNKFIFLFSLSEKKPCGIVEDVLHKHDPLFMVLWRRSWRKISVATQALALSSAGGSSQPGWGLPAAVQHALPHAVVVRAGASPAQRGRGLAAPAHRRADLPGHQRRLTAGDEAQPYRTD